MNGLNEFGRLKGLRMTRNPSYWRERLEDDDFVVVLRVKASSGFNSITALDTFSTAIIQVGRRDAFEELFFKGRTFA